jgi:rod shape determining protein RodA
MIDFGYSNDRHARTLLQKLADMSWLLILLITLTCTIGFVMLYSVAGGSFEPWAGRQIIRFGIGFSLFFVVALVDVRVWMAIAYPFYFIAFVLLILVELAGFVGMGAQRWIDLGLFQLQPAELMKIGLVLALSRFYHGQNPESISRPTVLIIPVLMILIPTIFVARQPDLGTAMLMFVGGAGTLFVAGVSWRYFLAGGALGVAAIFPAWSHLRDYQRERVLTFLDPGRDPLGAGYHILQSKIALGSGSMFGKGFMQGTQSQLDFLPEKQTDFIFTVLGEEWGLVGGLGLLALYFVTLLVLYIMALQIRHQFGRLLVLGISVMFFLYLFINTAMVMGLVPVVGIPLPFISYGGTAMMTLLISFGLVMSAYVHRDIEIPRRPGAFA